MINDKVWERKIIKTILNRLLHAAFFIRLKNDKECIDMALRLVFICISFVIVSAMDYEDVQHIESGKMVFCQKHNRLPYCADVPIGNSWRN